MIIFETDGVEDQEKITMDDHPQIDIIGLFVNEAILDQWQLQGLPSDELSRQNGVICTNAPTYPLLIDPQGQAHRWITQRHKRDNLIITSFEHRYFKSHVEQALQDGRPLLIEDCGEEIDPLLDNVLAKNWIRSGRLIQVSLAGREVSVSEGFKMYFTTKLANPRFSPETFAKTAVIEFSVTQFGLEEQLLNLVILREKENLENERQRLLEQVAGLRKMLLDLENLLLEQLRSSEGNLLENTTLISTLASTKQKSQENKESLASAMETKEGATSSSVFGAPQILDLPLSLPTASGRPKGNTTFDKNKSASILSGEIAPNLSIQTGNSIRDSAAFNEGSSQNESATLRNNFSYQEGSSANISAGNTETTSETMNVGKQTSGNLTKTSGHIEIDASHQNAVKNKTQTDTRLRAIYYDDGAAVLSEAVGQFDSVQSVLRSATMYGGQSMATQLSQKIADEEGKKTLFDKADIPQVRRENLDEKYLARESEILSNYAPAHVSKPDLQEPQDEVGKVQENLNRLNAEHTRRVEVAKEYRSEETGLGTLGKNALLGGYGYDDPHERLKEKQEKP